MPSATTACQGFNRFRTDFELTDPRWDRTSAAGRAARATIPRDPPRRDPSTREAPRRLPGLDEADVRLPLDRRSSVGCDQPKRHVGELAGPASCATEADSDLR